MVIIIIIIIIKIYTALIDIETYNQSVKVSACEGIEGILGVSSDIYHIFTPLRPQCEDHTTTVSKSANQQYALYILRSVVKTH